MTVHRLDLGYVIRPADEVGDAHPRADPCLAYVVRHRDGAVLFDTGIGEVDAETEAHYRPRRHDLVAALARVGVAPSDVRMVVNCHLHFDHCGGNPLFAGTPVFVQPVELAAAQAGGYTLESLVDFTGARYESVDGEAEILPGVWIVPTPGHTPGHQSLAVREPDGTVILAGQAHDLASQYAAEWLARRVAHDGAAAPLPPYAAFLDRLARFDPRRVLFAHDASVWEP